MWIGRPLFTSSVAKILRKSRGVNFNPRNPGWASARGLPASTDHLLDGARALRNLAISVFRQDGRTNIAAACRHTARHPQRPLRALGIS